MSLPSRSVGFITGHKGEGLRTIEGRTGTFIFTNASDRSGETEEVRRLYRTDTRSLLTHHTVCGCG
jgi:hypothetical protein